MQRHQRKSRNGSSDKLDFTLSISDIMSGLLFIFIIILVYFIMEHKNITSEFNSNKRVRAEVLIALKKEIEEVLRKEFNRKIVVEIDVEKGVLRLPDQHFFDTCEYEFKNSGKNVISEFRRRIFKRISCSTTGIKGLCDNGKLRIESFYVEGHSDCMPVSLRKSKNNKCYRNGIYSNMQLSSLRSLSAFNVLKLKDNNVDIMSLKNLNNEPIFSISAYGEYRSLSSASCKNKNGDLEKDRRIEFKIQMHLPKKLTGEKNGS